MKWLAGWFQPVSCGFLTHGLLPPSGSLLLDQFLSLLIPGDLLVPCFLFLCFHPEFTFLRTEVFSPNWRLVICYRLLG